LVPLFSETIVRSNPRFEARLAEHELAWGEVIEPVLGGISRGRVCHLKVLIVI
jgi:hypothetical protein